MYIYIYMCVYVYIYIWHHIATTPPCTYLFVFFKCIFPCQPLAKALNTSIQDMK